MGIGAATLVAVGLSAALWAALHSLLIARPVERRLLAALRRHAPWFRLLYNLFAAATLTTLLLWWLSLPARMLFAWPGWWQAVRWTGLLLALALFVAGALAYRGVDFLGIQTIRAARFGRPAAAAFRRAGILARVRHPWYSGTILFLLCCCLWTDVNLVWRAVFIAYTLVGTELEERKLTASLGATYREYVREAPRYVPRLRRRRGG